LRVGGVLQSRMPIHALAGPPARLPGRAGRGRSGRSGRGGVHAVFGVSPGGLLQPRVSARRLEGPTQARVPAASAGVGVMINIY
jgi:hypothetical protein